ncbi:MAG: glycosyltransferase family A protein, partial [Cyanobacteria bacterium J06648_11]
MSIAVIIPVYNGEGYLRRTLESVFSQTRRPEEVIVIDDGSSDASLAIAKTFDGLTILTNPDKGANSARQFGIQQSTADNIAFLD